MVKKNGQNKVSTILSGAAQRSHKNIEFFLTKLFIFTNICTKCDLTPISSIFPINFSYVFVDPMVFVSVLPPLTPQQKHSTKSDSNLISYFTMVSKRKYSLPTPVAAGS